MILQALVDYYERERKRPDSDIAPPGWIRRPLDYEFVLTPEGKCIQIVAAYQQIKDRKVGRSALLPAIGKQALKHTNSGNDANLLWDNAGFVLGRGKKGSKKFNSFVNTLSDWFGSVEDEGLAALKRFLSGVRESPGEIEALLRASNVINDFESRDPVIAFRLVGDDGLMHERGSIISAYDLRVQSMAKNAKRGRCLVTGRVNVPLAENETVIKGVWNAQAAGGNIVSFNAQSFVSYGKGERQAELAPISVGASAAYSASLNYLLSGNRHRAQIGDSSTVFWADRPSRFSGEFTIADLLGDGDDPARNTRAVQALFESLKSGILGGSEGDTKFFVLGLSPNQGRLSVRFWLHAPLRELAPRIAQHFRDLAVVRQFDSDSATPSLSRLLRALAVQEKLENVPPRLAGEWLRAILTGSPHPQMLLNAVVMRCRSEQATTDSRGNVSYLRAAILKAWLNRDYRRRNSQCSSDYAHFKEDLDVTQPDVAYRLGRLFAVLERVQLQAQGSLNATIRDRYYGAASTTPIAVFATLLRLKNAHLRKLGEAPHAYFERLIGEIFGTVEAPALDAFPAQLTLAEQGRFALGYYHQRQSFFAGRDKNTSEEPNNEERT